MHRILRHRNTNYITEIQKHGAPPQNELSNGTFDKKIGEMMSMYADVEHELWEGVLSFVLFV